MESTLGILHKGYAYFNNKFRKEDPDIYRTRLMLRKTIVIRGREAASIFYDTARFRREGATPSRFKKTLLGAGGVQGLDGKQHLHRKDLFMRMMGPDQLKRMEIIFQTNWKAAILRWTNTRQVNLFDEAEKILCLSAFQWVGIPLPEEQLAERTRQLSAMIDGSGAIGKRHFAGRKARRNAEKWLSGLIRELREHRLILPGESIFSQFCFFRDPRQQLLPARIIAVEILNLLRPTVAVARYIVFMAHALHHHPSYYKTLKDNDPLIHQFVQEVRRHYPFFPFVAARVKEPFSWKGVSFPKNRRVLLDLYGTNHDERIWEDPEEFVPARFSRWQENPWELIPQGGGDHSRNHRCAGEWMTIVLMKTALFLMVNQMDYYVPGQDLSIDLSRIPAIPRSRFIITEVIAHL